MSRTSLLRLTLFLAAFGLLAACGSSNDDNNGSDPNIGSSRSYKGHTTDLDSNNLVKAYPALRATRLDDCQTCHRSGEVLESGATKKTVYNPCTFCHARTADPKPEGAPTSIADTLNAFGKDYLAHGRTVQSLKDIANSDSDSDTFSNAAEIAALRYPGDAASFPGQKVAPTLTLTEAQIKAMTQSTQFMLMNANKQTNDEYAVYSGVTLKELLTKAGVDLSGATGVTLYAPDGFTVSYAIADLDLEFPEGTFYAGLQKGGTTLGDNGFVLYPEQSLWPTGMTDGGKIPGKPAVLLATSHNGTALEPGSLDDVSGKINGEGPFRGIMPQKTAGRPDRGRSVTPLGDNWDYLETADHNAGNCPKVTVAIRIDPMPTGVEEFDWKNGGWALVDDKIILIYGHGVKAP